MCSDAGHQITRASGGVSPFGHPGSQSGYRLPRLIADSYVLLRLLMPRHPPCALKNLTTKDQGVIFERTTETNHTQQHHPTKRAVPSRAARSRFIFLEIASYKRCSRPLCSSQTTTPYHTPHTQPPQGQTCMIGAARKPETQVPERQGSKTTPPPGPVASGPNSVPNTKPHNPNAPHRSRTGPQRGTNPY
jgi:hypothetical protein